MDDTKQFFDDGKREIAAMGDDASLADLSRDWMLKATEHKYTYHFTWCGRPMIQLPQDVVAMQELIWEVQPDLIIETGIARGGSIIFYATMLELVGGEGKVLGIDIDIREHNRKAIEANKFYHRIEMIQGSSIDADIVKQVHERAAAAKKVIVVLDSNHTHDHVLEELRAYAPLVTKGSWLVVFDTAVELLPDSAFTDRPWGPGNSPLSALKAYMQECDRFEIDPAMHHKLQLTVAPSGWLRCVKD